MTILTGLVLFVGPVFGFRFENWPLWIALWLGGSMLLVGAAIVAQSLTIDAELRRGYITLPHTVENTDLRHHRDGRLLRAAGQHYREGDDQTVGSSSVGPQAGVNRDSSTGRSPAFAVGILATLGPLIGGVALAIFQWRQADGPDRAQLLIISTVVTAVATSIGIGLWVLLAWSAQRRRLRLLAERFPKAMLFHSVRSMDLVSIIWRTSPGQRITRRHRPISFAFAVSIDESGVGLWERGHGEARLFIPRDAIRSLGVREVPNERPPHGGPALIVGAADGGYYPLRLWLPQRGYGKGLSAQQLAEVRENASRVLGKTLTEPRHADIASHLKGPRRA